MITSFPLSLFIGYRFIKSRRYNGMVSIVSIISIMSITISMIVLIVGLSIMNGFEYELNNRILAVVLHGEIESVNPPWRNWNKSLQKIKNISEVIAAAPYISFTGLLINKEHLRIIQVKGINPQQENHLSVLPKFVQNNAWKNLKAGERQIIIGKEIARFLQVKQGDWISMIILDNSTNRNYRQFRNIRLHVTGIFQIHGQLDHSFAMIPLEDANQYLNTRNGITGIAIKVSNILNASKVVREVGKVIDEYVYTKSWMDTHGYIYNDIRMIRAIIYLSMALVMGISCFNIISVLMIAVKEKSSDIAILCALGAKDILIRIIFFWYGLFIGIIGSLYGIVIGVVISLRLTFIIQSIERLIGYKVLSSDIYFVNFLPSILHWLDIAYILMIILFLSLLASWYPAYRASHINPVTILSNR